MEKVIVCVPNFSEGRNRETITLITDEIKKTKNVMLLDVDPGIDTNRSVVTFAGNPEAVVDAAFRATKKASECIDMSNHKGAHPRMGATDVCPLIPVSGITLAETVQYAQNLAKRIGDEIAIPVYLYGEAATNPNRKKLSDIRKGEYEALPEKLKDKDFTPDEGPTVFNKTAGATAVGVRDFMLAYNVNLNTKDARLAKKIAQIIRESGRIQRDEQGDIIRDSTGKAVTIPGKLQYCQAAGWYIDEYGYAQVTMNLHNFPITGLHTAFDTICEEATKLGLRVTGSEIVGLIPKKAITDAGKHYLKKQGKITGVTDKALIHAAILSLGLNDTTPFDPQTRIIEFCIQKKNNQLIDKTVQGFVNELSSNSPAPGGGSVSALSGALSAALSSMVAGITFGKKAYNHENDTMEEMAHKAQILKHRYLQLIDKDTDAFNQYMRAMGMPKKNTAERVLREKAMERATRGATEVPLETLTLALSLLELSEIAVKKGNVNALSDAAVGALQAEAAAGGAWFNVMINLPGLSDKKYIESVTQEAQNLLDTIKRKGEEIVTLAKKRIVS